MAEVEIKAQWFEWLKSDKKFTAQDVQELVDLIKEFNAGAVDEYLSNHVNKVFNEWMDKHE